MRIKRRNGHYPTIRQMSRLIPISHLLIPTPRYASHVLIRTCEMRSRLVRRNFQVISIIIVIKRRGSSWRRRIRASSSRERSVNERTIRLSEEKLNPPITNQEGTCQVDVMQQHLGSGSSPLQQEPIRNRTCSIRESKLERPTFRKITRRSVSNSQVRSYRLGLCIRLLCSESNTLHGLARGGCQLIAVVRGVSAWRGGTRVMNSEHHHRGMWHVRKTSQSSHAIFLLS